MRPFPDTHAIYQYISSIREVSIGFHISKLGTVTALYLGGKSENMLSWKAYFYDF